MSRQIAPEIDDGNLIIDDVIIAPEEDVASMEQTESAAVNGRDTYRVAKTDGTVLDVVVAKRTGIEERVAALESDIAAIKNALNI